MIELLNGFAQSWWSWMWPMSWQVCVLVILVGAADLLLRRRAWPQVRYALWLLILVKLVVPPTFSLSTGVVSYVRLMADRPPSRVNSASAPADLPYHRPGLDMSTDPAGVEMVPFPAGENLAGQGTVRYPERSSSRDAKLGRKAYLMTVWLIGMGILSWWLVARLRGLRRHYGQKPPEPDLPVWFGPLLTETAQKLHLGRLPEITLSRDIPSPAVFGVFKPVLVLPEAAVGRLSRERAEHILLHELAHIKRGDLPVNAFYTLLQIVYWFNPLLWLLRRRLQHLRELCCDATVARILRDRTPEYRETILETARRLLAKPAEPGIGLLGLFESSSSLRVRLKWLEKKTWRHRGLRIATILAVVTGMCVFILPMAKATKTGPSLDTDGNWPCFRGPGGSGISAHSNIPVGWDGPSGRGILWKSPVPLDGNNSPIVWGDRVFIAGGTGDKYEVYCYDGSSGLLLWTGSVPMTRLPNGEEFEPFEDTGYATPTMVTDGKRVCAIFVTGDVGCFDFHGRRLWTKSLGIPDSAYGYASSLAVFRNLAIVQYDQAGPDDGKSGLLALNMASGEIVWRTKRPVANSWTSPIITRIEGRDTIVTAADPWVIAYDPATGTELWRAECLAGDIASSPIYANGRVFAIEPYSKLVAIEAGGRGDVTKTHLAWNNEDGGPDICSPLSDGKSIYLLADGLLTCLAISDGKTLWEEDLREYFFASPSLVGDKMYLLSDKGNMFIIKPGAEYKLLGKSALGEECRASPAFADGRIYIRGQKNLYCIGGAGEKAESDGRLAAMDTHVEGAEDKPGTTRQTRGSTSRPNSDDFLHFLEARDESIVNYEIKLRRVRFDIESDRCEAFRERIEQLAKHESAGVSPSKQAEQLVQTWGGKVRWLEEHVLHRGEHFKETVVFASGSTRVSSYDGRLYSHYRPGQLDIHAKIPNVWHATLRELGLAAKGIRKSGKLVSFEQDQDGVRCLFSRPGEDPYATTRAYDRDFSLCHLQYRFSDKSQLDHYYMFHENIDGYQIPRIKVELDHGHKRGCSVYLHVIEDVRLNCALTDEDLSVGDLPDRALVQDYRFEPDNQWHYNEYRLAVENPEIVRAGRCEPEDMVRRLNKTRSGREALSTRDSRIGRKAPALETAEWLLNPPGTDTWPTGRFTVLNFCSIGCGFCIREIPENNELGEWVKSRGGNFLAIHSVTAESGKIKDAFGSRGVPYPMALDRPGGERAYWGSATFARYGINSIPKYVTISEDGRVLSYDRSLTKEMLQTLMTSDPNEVVARARRKEVRRLTAIPNGWIAGDLEPDSRVLGRFFVFREDTPDLKLRRSDTAGTEVEFNGTHHSADGQTVYEVLLTAKAPSWGGAIKGRVSLIAGYGQAEELLTIPYELASKSLAKCVCPSVCFGVVQKGKTVVRRTKLQRNPNHKVAIIVVSAPSDFQLRINGLGGQPGEILAECSFRSDKPGFQKGTAKFLLRDREGNEQPLTFDYSAFVLP
ncbi:MAG: M56 family metallopeptidase [Planctomycetota bacterium]|jgi:beta-lactamase regulating signal transducer with metallopeptidase domain/outer membrane protein assembly factor BamB